MRLIGKISQYEKIVAYMKDPEADEETLSEKEKEMLDRWIEAFTFMRNYNSMADAAALLMKRFPGLSRSTAYRDCSSALSLFGDIALAKKDGIKHLATEIVRDSIAIARLKNNEDGMRQGASAMATINGVNITDPDLPDFAKLEPHEYVIGLPENFITAFQNAISGGHMDFSKVVNNMAANAEDAIVIEEDGSND